MKKTGELKSQHIDLQSVFWALSHETRRKILLFLQKEGGSLICGEIADKLSCSWPTTTRHLHVLEKANLIVSQKHGRLIIYKINKKSVKAVIPWFVLLSKG